MAKRRANTGRRSDRGAVAVTTALFLPVLFGFFALAFNVGLMMDSRAELQNGSDAAALAAARSLNGMASGLAAARQNAYAYSMKHMAYDEAITIDAADRDVTFGRWHLRPDECKFGSTGSDCFEVVPVGEPRKITAVRVRNGRDGGSHNSPLSLLFGSFVGSATATVRSAAVAVGGGPGTPACVLPMAVAECQIVDAAGAMKCDPMVPQRLVFSDANADAIGFANLDYPDDKGEATGNNVAVKIRGGLCNPHYKLGPAKLQNGNDFKKVFDALRGVDKNGVSGPCVIGKPMSFPVTDAGCPGNPIFQGVQDVVGFVKGTVVAVTDGKGNALACPGDPAPVVAGKPTNAVVLDFPCQASADTGDSAGGRAYNVKDNPTRLVQ